MHSDIQTSDNYRLICYSDTGSSGVECAKNRGVAQVHMILEAKSFFYTILARVRISIKFSSTL